MNKIPKNEAALEEVLHKTEKFRNDGDFKSALQICTCLLDEPTTRSAGLRARADIYAEMREKELELIDRELLVDFGSEEPSDHFELGIGLWRSGRLPEAIAAFSSAIKLGEKEEFNYYTNSSRIHLAALLLKLNRREEAARVCSLIPENYSSYLPIGMMTKEDLMEILK